ncbi:MAG: CARDB domain-containing protein [Chitinophagaceae bacterium]
MKKIVISITCLLYAFVLLAQDPAYPPAPPAPQNIIQAEYFIDNDPGFGNGTAIPVTPGIDVNGISASINTTGLSNGIHRIYIRSKNSSGKWSLSAIKEFLYDFDPSYPLAPSAPQNIIGAEYFFDTDPGFGNAVAIPITAGIDLNNISTSVNTSGLLTGVHRFYLRTLNAAGKWSITTIQDFLVDFDPPYSPTPPAPQNIITAEYFIDTDPGFGNATAISLTPGIDINSVTAAINTTGLTTGVHYLFLRTKNNAGKWSVTNVKDFLVNLDPAYPAAPPAPQNIISAEYFIDTDPGLGNANAISVTPGIDVNNISSVINTTGLTTGVHYLFLRTKNNEGKWSITNVKDFLVNLDPAYPAAPPAPQNITNAEYFIDTDPGIGSGTSINITPGLDISNIPVAVNIASLTAGEHNLFLRTRNANGKWSITNYNKFNLGTLTILPDSIVFLTTIINTTATRSLVVKNNSSSSQTITGVTIAAPFTSDFSSARIINAGQTDTIKISFTPTAATQYQDIINLQTSAGTYNIPVKGTAVAIINEWVLEPATGHDYGNIQTGSSSNFNFSIRNTGNAAITLNQVISSDASFVPGYTSGTVIPVGSTITLPVSFNPTAVTSYNAVLKIKASAGGPDSAMVVLNGTGFTPATAPTLSFISAPPYDGARGVNPAAGQTGNYTYKIMYRSADNRAPLSGQPQVGIDLTGDQDFDDAGEGIFAMAKEGSGTDYITGVVYSYTVNYANYSSTMGYRFFAKDALGNSATAANLAYYSGPIVTYQLLDLKLFANNISFSKANPQPNEIFTVTASITNNSAFNATNVPIYFYRDTILIGSTILPASNAFSTTNVSRQLSFGADGFYPIKVWIDPNQTLSETNILNNYAIRPVIVGSPVLPGGITVNGSTLLQNCPAQKIIFSGHADYFGTAIPSVVAGAEVSINTGTSILKTTTDANGNYTLVMENPPCGNVLTYTVSVTDFTFTSNTFTGAVNVPCPGPTTCAPPPTGGGIAIAISTPACQQIVGGTSTAQLTITYRGRNIANMWSLWDKIWKDTVKVFNDGVLIQTYYTNDIPDFGSAGTFPGDVKTFPVTVPLSTTGPHNIVVVATYQYNEFFQNETYFYHGTFTQETATASATIFAQENKPDLTLDNFRQSNFRSFTFDDKNLECVDAGLHLVRIVEVTTPGSPVLVQENSISSVPGKSSVAVSVSLPSLSIGTHIFRVVTDTTALLSETNENNNAFLVTLVVPAPDLTVSKVSPTSTSLSVGSSVAFTATVKNSGVSAGPFVVRFLANGVPIGGDINVASIGEKGSVIVTSNAFTVTTPDFACPFDIIVIADAASTISESDETNNTAIIKLGADIQPLQLPGEFGSSSNPAKVRVNTSKQFNAYVRNIGTRDIRNITVKFMENGVKLGEALIPVIKAGIDLPAVASFTHTFTTVGPVVVDVVTDTANAVCELSEINNTGPYHILVTDSKEDFVVLSQFISPSSLNPNAGQNITIVGTVKNIGNKVAPPSNLRFYVDNIQLGTAIPFNTLQIGQDTTVAASVTYSSIIAGVKVVKIIVDGDGLVSEEDENNNEATRAIIVGDAPDMTRNAIQPINFNPNGFSAGDSVTVSYQIRNSGTNLGTAWARLKIFDGAGSLTAIDSVQFTLAAGSNTTIFKKMFFAIDSGYVVAEILNCSPLESNLLNNTDTLPFSTVAKMKASLIVNNLDMKAGVPQQLPGWIGGKILLGDFDLTVNGNIVNVDTSHFVITNGTGRLTIINSNTQNVYPVGPSMFKTNFVKINNTGTPDNFTVRVQPYLLRNGNAGDTIKTGTLNRTWLIDEQTPGGSNATVEFFWNAGDELPAFDRNASRAAHFTSSWQLGTLGAALQDSIGRYSRSQAGYNSFSPFTVTSEFGGLPLSLLSFTAIPKQDDVLLNWITDNEVNTSHFDIEFSSDGSNFNKVGFVKAANTGGKHQYSFTHKSPVGSVVYYRLKQLDNDGKFTYSPIVKVSRKADRELVLYPNPSRQFIELKNIAPEQISDLSVLSSEGKLVLALKATNQQRYDISRLKNGVYFLQVIRKDRTTQTIPFIKN